MKRHLFRIIASVVLTTIFIVVMVRTESFFWLGVECAVAAGIAYFIIAVDAAIEYPDEFEQTKYKDHETKTD